MTHQPDAGGQQAAANRPTTYSEASGSGWDFVKAQARCGEPTDRGLYARRADLEARGEYDPATQEYREWAEGQHNLWTGKWDGTPESAQSWSAQG